MPDYALQFEADGIGAAKRIEFEADNSGAAFDVLRSEAKGRSVVIEENDRVLAVVTCLQDDFWAVR